MALINLFILFVHDHSTKIRILTNVSFLFVNNHLTKD